MSAPVVKVQILVENLTRSQRELLEALKKRKSRVPGTDKILVYRGYCWLRDEPARRWQSRTAEPLIEAGLITAEQLVRRA